MEKLLLSFKVLILLSLNKILTNYGPLWEAANDNGPASKGDALKHSLVNTPNSISPIAERPSIRTFTHPTPVKDHVLVSKKRGDHGFDVHAGKTFFDVLHRAKVDVPRTGEFGIFSGCCCLAPAIWT